MGYRDIWRLTCRIDHEGVVESEDKDVFLICAQELLLVAGRRGPSIERAIEQGTNGEVPAAEVLADVMQGLKHMIALTRELGMAMWTNGGEEELKMLVESMRRASLGPDDPDYWEPRHIGQRRSEIRKRLAIQARELGHFGEC